MTKRCSYLEAGKACGAPLLKGNADRCFVHDGMYADLDWSPSDDDAPDAPQPRSARPATVSASPRPAPVLDVETIDPEWPTDWLPEPVRDWVEAIAATFAVPRVMPIAVALCAAATLAQGKAVVRIKAGWEEPLSLFWAVAAPTGSRKSAVLTAGTKYIRVIQQSQEEAISEHRRAAEARLKHAESQRRSLNAKVKYCDRKDAGSNEWKMGQDNPAEDLREVEADIRRLTQSRTATREPGIPSAPRWLREDINPTVIPAVMRQNYEAEGIARMAILEGEGTFLQNAMGRHSHQQTAVEPLLKAYQGEPLELTRRAPNSADLTEVSLPACHLTMLTLVQPHVLSKLTATGELADNGLLGRCIATMLPSKPSLPPLDAPQVPEAVQAAYDRWLWDIHCTPLGTVVDLSVYAEPGMPLRDLYEKVGAHLQTESGAAGWSIRSVGRVARIMALTELSNCRTGEEPSGVVGGSSRGVLVMNTLIHLLYLQGLSRAQAAEPEAAPTSTLTHRALAWLRRFDSSTVGRIFAIRELQRALKLSHEAAATVCDELLTVGVLEQLSEVRNRNKTVTVTYRVIALPESAPAARPVQHPPSKLVGDDLT